jgi:hypothetical protein
MTVYLESEVRRRELRDSGWLTAQPESSHVGKGHAISPSPSRFDADAPIHRESKLMITAEVIFGRLDGRVTEQELDLVELTLS